MVNSLYDMVHQAKSTYTGTKPVQPGDRETLKKLYEERDSNPIVKGMLKGETNFVDELIKYFDGQTGNREALEECLGIALPRPLDPKKAMVAGGIGAAITLGLKSREINRRNFVRIGVLTAAALAFAGGLQYGLNQLDSAGAIDHFKRAQFLDNTYKSLS